MAVTRPEPEEKRERTAYEGASIVFGLIIVLFGVWGAAASLADGEGVVSAGFVISVVFVLLGAGRAWIGFRR